MTPSTNSMTITEQRKRVHELQRLMQQLYEALIAKRASEGHTNGTIARICGVQSVEIDRLTGRSQSTMTDRVLVPVLTYVGLLDLLPEIQRARDGLSERLYVLTRYPQAVADVVFDLREAAASHPRMLVADFARIFEPHQALVEGTFFASASSCNRLRDEPMLRDELLKILCDDAELQKRIASISRQRELQRAQLTNEWLTATQELRGRFAFRQGFADALEIKMDLLRQIERGEASREILDAAIAAARRLLIGGPIVRKQSHIARVPSLGTAPLDTPPTNENLLSLVERLRVKYPSPDSIIRALGIDASALEDLHHGRLDPGRLKSIVAAARTLVRQLDVGEPPAEPAIESETTPSPPSATAEPAPEFESSTDVSGSRAPRPEPPTGSQDAPALEPQHDSIPEQVHEASPLEQEAPGEPLTDARLLELLTKAVADAPDDFITSCIERSMDHLVVLLKLLGSARNDRERERIRNRLATPTEKLFAALQTFSLIYKNRVTDLLPAFDKMKAELRSAIGQPTTVRRRTESTKGV